MMLRQLPSRIQMLFRFQDLTDLRGLSYFPEHKSPLGLVLRRDRDFKDLGTSLPPVFL